MVHTSERDMLVCHVPNLTVVHLLGHLSELILVSEGSLLLPVGVPGPVVPVFITQDPPLVLQHLDVVVHL